MKNQAQIFKTLVASGGFAALAACSNSPVVSSIPPASSLSARSAGAATGTATRGRVFVSDGAKNEVLIFSEASGTKTASRAISTDLIVPETVAIGSNDSQIFIGDSGNTNRPDSVIDLTYPAGKKLRLFPRFGFNVAVSPASRI